MEEQINTPNENINKSDEYNGSSGSDEKLYHAEHRHTHKHHHSHHIRHRRKHSSKKKKITAFFKRYKNVLINVLSCSISVILLILLATDVDKTDPSVVDESNYTGITQSIIKIETSLYSEPISLVSGAISYYMDSSNDCTALEAYRAFNGYTKTLNYGSPVTLIYRIIGLPSGVFVQSARLYLSESETYQPAQAYLFDVDAEKIDIYNLKTATQYYYRLNVSLTNECVIETAGSFKTDVSPRILNIEGAVNVRDIGGWNTVDGKTVRQGLLFRGSEMDGAVEPSYLITDKGLHQMTGELGVRFDMDLRSPTDNKNGTHALGNNVIHKYYNAPMYSDILQESGREVVKNIFADLANPDNYPIYLHCTYGRDRTGTICYLLEALLGMSDEDLYTEYELTLFTDSYVNYAEFSTFLERIRSLEGYTTKEKVEGWLISIGVSEEQIVSIREIFLGE